MTDHMDAYLPRSRHDSPILPSAAGDCRGLVAELIDEPEIVFLLLGMQDVAVCNDCLHECLWTSSGILHLANGLFAESNRAITLRLFRYGPIRQL